MKNDIKALYIQIPKAVHDKVKIRAIVHNCSVRSFVLKALIEQIKKEEAYEANAESVSVGI